MTTAVQICQKCWFDAKDLKQEATSPKLFYPFVPWSPLSLIPGLQSTAASCSGQGSA